MNRNVKLCQQFLQYQQNEQSHKQTQYISVVVITLTFDIHGSRKPKVHSQGSQPWLRSPMPE
jgi:hypothetical protein